jgi:hypothetical protein
VKQPKRLTSERRRTGVDNAVFDASALLALLLGEPGGAGVERLLPGGRLRL